MALIEVVGTQIKPDELELQTQNNKHMNAHLERTCKLIIQHLKNVMIFQSEVNMPWGYHSRFMERMLHPEDKLIFKGTSQKLIDDNKLLRRKEHIVPMDFLLNGLWELIEKGEHSDKQLLRILKKNLGIAYIAQEEAYLLDSKQMGLKTSMPADWCLEKGDPLERLRVAGIVLVDDKLMQINTLLNS